MSVRPVCIVSGMSLTAELKPEDRDEMRSNVVQCGCIGSVIIMHCSACERPSRTSEQRQRSATCSAQWNYDSTTTRQHQHNINQSPSHYELKKIHQHSANIYAVIHLRKKIEEPYAKRLRWGVYLLDIGYWARKQIDHWVHDTWPGPQQTFPAAECHRPLTGTKLYCLVNWGTCASTTWPGLLPSSVPAGNRTGNLTITSSTRHHHITKPLSNYKLTQTLNWKQEY